MADFTIDALSVSSSRSSSIQLQPETHKGDLIFKFSNTTNDGGVAPTCAICLTEYQDGDEICWSHNNRCYHVFHRDCILEWLLRQDECPCCRLNFLSLGDRDQSSGRYRQIPPVVAQALPVATTTAATTTRTLGDVSGGESTDRGTETPVVTAVQVQEQVQTQTPMQVQEQVQTQPPAQAQEQVQAQPPTLVQEQVQTQPPTLVLEQTPCETFSVDGTTEVTEERLTQLD